MKASRSSSDLIFAPEAWACPPPSRLFATPEIDGDYWTKARDAFAKGAAPSFRKTRAERGQQTLDKSEAVAVEGGNHDSALRGIEALANEFIIAILGI